MLSHDDARWYNLNNIYAGTPPPARAGRTGSRATPGWQPQKRNRRLRLLLLLLVGALIISTVLVASDLYRASTALLVQVGSQQAAVIDLNQSVAISPYLLGSNVFPRAGTSSKDQVGSGFMSYDQQVMLGLRSAGVKLLRFPGGNWGEQHTPSPEQLNDFSGLLNQVGAQGIMQVQLSDPEDTIPVPLQTRASRAALLVDYMNNRKSIQRMDAKAPFHPITYWTIGNEPDLLINPDTHERYTVEEYTQAFIAYSIAMHRQDPNIKVFGPEISRYGGQQEPRDAHGELWMEGFLREISAYEQVHALPFHLLDGVSFHYYPFGATREDASALLNNPGAWDSILPSLRQYIRQQFAEDLPIAVTEINTNPGQIVPSQALAADWWADTLGKLMSNQVEYAAFFSTEGVDTPYPLFTRQNLQATAMLRAMQLFAHLQQNSVPLQVEGSQVSMYVTQDQEHATVSALFINKTGAKQRVRVESAGFLPLGPWQQAALTIPGYGMAVLTLQRGGGDEAFSFSNRENAQQVAPGLQHLACASDAGAALTC